MHAARLILIVVTTLVAAFAPIVNAFDCPIVRSGPIVTFYDDTNFRGSDTDLQKKKRNTYTVSNRAGFASETFVDSFNDAAKSVRFERDIVDSVVLFEHANLRGRNAVLRYSSSSLVYFGVDFGVSSYKVMFKRPDACCVRVFEHYNFEGKMRYICQQNGNVSLFEVFPPLENLISSIQVGENTAASFRDIDGSGTCDKVYGPVSISPNNWNVTLFRSTCNDVFDSVSVRGDPSL